MSTPAQKKAEQQIAAAITKAAQLLSASDIERLVEEKLDEMIVNRSIKDDNSDYEEHKIMFFKSVQKTMLRELASTNPQRLLVHLVSIEEFQKGRTQSHMLTRIEDMDFHRAWNEEVSYLMRFVDRPALRFGNFLLQQLVIDRESLQEMWRHYQALGTTLHRDPEHGGLRVLGYATVENVMYLTSKVLKSAHSLDGVLSKSSGPRSRGTSPSRH